MLTMLSLQLVMEPKMELTTGLSKILGVLPGVMPVISKFKEELTCVVSPFAMLSLMK